MLKAQVPREAETPAFGAWVKVVEDDGQVIYGVVSMVEQGSLLPNRRATALGKTADELVREMPQVFELLRTSFTALIVAYRDAQGAFRQTLPPNPARIHGFVEACSMEELRQLKPPLDFLRTLVQRSDGAAPMDDLLVSLLRHLRAGYSAEGEEEGYRILVEAGRTLSRLLSDDHERLQSILRRIA